MILYAWIEHAEVELEIEQEDIEACTHPGQCFHDVAYVRLKPYIMKQLDKINASDVRLYLSEFGAWDNEELQNHEENLLRLVWCACGSIEDETE